MLFANKFVSFFDVHITLLRATLHASSRCPWQTAILGEHTNFIRKALSAIEKLCPGQTPTGSLSGDWKSQDQDLGAQIQTYALAIWKLRCQGLAYVAHSLTHSLDKCCNCLGPMPLACCWTDASSKHTFCITTGRRILRA